MNGSVGEKGQKMQKITDEISKEEYDKLQHMDYERQHEELFPNGVPDAWEYGYGYYGHSVYEKDGKFYVAFKIGNSCD